MKSTTTKHACTNHFCKFWQEIPACSNNENEGNENNTMIGFLTILALVLNVGLAKFLESEALFSIDGTQKYFLATPRSTNQTTYV